MRPGDPRDMLEVAPEEPIVARLRRQNHEHAALRDRQVAALQSRVDKFENAICEARSRVRGTPVDWTNDPPSRKPDGWWNYTSVATREVIIAAVWDHAGRRRRLIRLLAAFAVGLAAGLLISDVRAAPRPAVQQGLATLGYQSTALSVSERRTPAPRASVAPAEDSGGSLTTRHTPGVRSPLPALTRSGIASTVGPRFSATYLALPDGPGFTVRICGAAACVTRTSTDAGPIPSLRRVADLSVADFEAVSGQPWRRGLTSVTLTVLRVPR